MENKLSKALEDLTAAKNFAVGNDLVCILEFKESCTQLFKGKVYTEGEIAYCDRFDNPILRYAATWAAKEAVYKALKQLDSSPIGWKKIEITRKKIGGQPGVIIHREGNQPQISLSISHDGDYVWAVALIENQP